MFNKITILALSILLYSLFIPKTSEAAETTEQQIIQQISVAPLTSSDVRKDLKYTVTLQPVGFGPIPEFSQGINIGYFLNPNSILQLEYTSSHTPFQTPAYSGANGYGSSTSSQRWYSSLRGYSLGIHLKQFFGNSFYVNGGVDYRNLSRNNDYEDLTNTSQSFSVGFSGTSVAAAISLGNQWQFSHFTIGCDWIGVSVPFSHTVQNESTVGPVSDDGFSARQTDESRYLSMPSIQVLRLYAGASF